ncbi:protein of unknown function [Methylorubrum extorquens]|uniref:Transposase n=1 Tax=Methylorubrum extorquens TaxID=408 RepID=A0A2N9AJR3_METEX|nr:protein of unknown function [Methylorubrum extorquens]
MLSDAQRGELEPLIEACRPKAKTRYEKTAVSFAGVLCLAATLDWLK